MVRLRFAVTRWGARKGSPFEGDNMAYQSRSRSAADQAATEEMDYTHTQAHQMAYDFSLYLHEKMKKRAVET